MTSHEDFELKVMASQPKYSTGKIGTPPAEEIMKEIKAKIPGPSDEYKAAVFAILQKKNKSESKEQSDLFPAGWEYAPRSAKKHRHFLEDANYVEHMIWLQNIVSYNADGTINLLPLNKTFCSDLTGKRGEMCHVIAGELACKKGYELLTDYNDCDTQVERAKTDFYKAINIFNPYGATNVNLENAREIFRDMTGCNDDDHYWTATRFRDKEGKLFGNSFLVRNFGMNCDYSRAGSHKDSSRHVCGWKDMAPSK